MNKKRFTRITVAAVIAAFGTQANAAESYYQDLVKTVYPFANGNFVVTFASSPAACLNGSNPKYFYVQVGVNGVTSEGAKAMLATALTAFATGRKLGVIFDDASYSCDINRMTVSE